MAASCCVEVVIMSDYFPELPGFSPHASPGGFLKSTKATGREAEHLPCARLCYIFRLSASLGEYLINLQHRVGMVRVNMLSLIYYAASSGGARSCLFVGDSYRLRRKRRLFLSCRHSAMSPSICRVAARGRFADCRGNK